jgi:hypothetical protein
LSSGSKHTERSDVSSATAKEDGNKEGLLDAVFRILSPTSRVKDKKKEKDK